jgi:hypothetical protein
VDFGLVLRRPIETAAFIRTKVPRGHEEYDTALLRGQLAVFYGGKIDATQKGGNVVQALSAPRRKKSNYAFPCSRPAKLSGVPMEGSSPSAFPSNAPGGGRKTVAKTNCVS